MIIFVQNNITIVVAVVVAIRVTRVQKQVHNYFILFYFILFFLFIYFYKDFLSQFIS